MSSTEATPQPAKSSWLKRALDSDIWYSFCRSPITIASAIMTLLFFLAAIFAPFVAPFNPFDLAAIDIMDASLPPAWQAEGDARFALADAWPGERRPGLGRLGDPVDSVFDDFVECHGAPRPDVP